jgi:hypothetical protein
MIILMLQEIAVMSSDIPRRPVQPSIQVWRDGKTLCPGLTRQQDVKTSCPGNGSIARTARLRDDASRVQEHSELATFVAAADEF